MKFKPGDRVIVLKCREDRRNNTEAIVYGYDGPIRAGYVPVRFLDYPYSSTTYHGVEETHVVLVTKLQKALE